jgi:hypothetical protein
MRCYICYFVEHDDGTFSEKWIPSADLMLIAEGLLNEMKGGRGKVDWFGPPFVLTLAAAFEANLNDWLIIHAYTKHGREGYKRLAQAYMAAHLADKPRLAVAVMTDNLYQVRDNSPIMCHLDEMIATRNKITHPKEYFSFDVVDLSYDDSSAPSTHPIHGLSLKQCREFMKAVRAFDRLFLDKYDQGKIRENDLVRKAGCP